MEASGGGWSPERPSYHQQWRPFSQCLAGRGKAAECAAKPAEPKVLPRDSHCHATHELLHRLAINGDSHTSISIKGEFQTVEHSGLLAVLCGAVCIIFVPTKSEQQIASKEPQNSPKSCPAHGGRGEA